MRFRIKEITYNDNSKKYFIQEKRTGKRELKEEITIRKAEEFFPVIIILIFLIFILPITILNLTVRRWKTEEKAYENLNEIKIKVKDLQSAFDAEILRKRKHKEKVKQNKRDRRIKSKRIITDNELKYPNK